MIILKSWKQSNFSNLWSFGSERKSSFRFIFFFVLFSNQIKEIRHETMSILFNNLLLWLIVHRLQRFPFSTSYPYAMHAWSDISSAHPIRHMKACEGFCFHCLHSSERQSNDMRDENKLRNYFQSWYCSWNF